MNPLDSRAQLLKELTEAPGLPGYEDRIREIFRREAEGIGPLSTDGVGSIACTKAGTAERPRIMLAGHMDEVGWLVRQITEEGFLKFSPLGGWWSQVMLAQRVTVYTRKGAFTGVIGCKPPHILTPDDRNKVVPIEKMYIDLGAPSAEYVRETMGVRIGDPIVPQANFQPVGDGKVYLAKAFDNRVAVGIVLEVLKALGDREHPNTVVGVGTVQEEVGLRGARTSSWLAEPDVAFSLDVGIAGDVPGVEPHEALMRLGAGPALVFYDRSLIPHLKLRDLVLDTAEEAGIPLQHDFVMGGTDGGAIHLHKAGVPTVTLAIPARHIHSHSSMIHRDDYDGMIALLLRLIEKLDAATVEELRF